MLHRDKFQGLFQQVKQLESVREKGKILNGVISLSEYGEKEDSSCPQGAHSPLSKTDIEQAIISLISILKSP